MKAMKTVTLSLSLALAVTSAPAQTAVQAWVQRYNGPENGDDRPNAITVNSDGNVIVSGTSVNANLFGDYVTIKYSNGGTPLWTNRYNGPGNSHDQAFGIAVATNGDVFVTGVSIGSGTGSDYATVAYSSAGAALWTNRYDGPSAGGDQASAIGMDSYGNLYVTGSSSFPGVGGILGFATIKYSDAGQGLWTNRYMLSNSRVYDHPAMAVHSNGNVFVSGGFVTPPFSGLGYTFLTVGYSNNGVLLWTNFYKASSKDDLAVAIAVGGSGNVYVTGQSALNNYDFATLAYSSAGAAMWTNRYNGTDTSQDLATAIALDPNENVYVTGYSSSINSKYDYATLAYSSAGIPLWTNRYNGPGNGLDRATAIAVDAKNNVYVTGYSASDSTGTNLDYATIAYTSAGTALWTNRFKGYGYGTNAATRIVLDKTGNVFVTGYSWNGTNFDYVTIRYSLTIPLQSQTVDDQLVLTWTNAAFALQSAPTITGTFTNLPGATSPYTNPITGAQQFFRLISD